MNGEEEEEKKKSAFVFFSFSLLGIHFVFVRFIMLLQHFFFYAKNRGEIFTLFAQMVLELPHLGKIAITDLYTDFLSW